MRFTQKQAEIMYKRLKEIVADNRHLKTNIAVTALKEVDEIHERIKNKIQKKQADHNGAAGYISRKEVEKMIRGTD